LSVSVAASQPVRADFAPAALLAAIEDNHREQLIWTGQAPGVETHVEPDVVWYTTGRPHAAHNRVFNARFAPEGADARIDAILAQFRWQGVPALWWVWPSSEPADLRERLIAHGLHQTRTSRGMVADLAGLNGDFPPPPALRIERVRDRAALRGYIQALSLGFSMPEVAAAGLYEQLAALDLGPDSPLQHYVGWLGDEPVACSTLFLGAGVASLSSVATVPAARRKGICTALTLAPLREARAAGYRIAVLLPSDAGYQVYRRVGFVELCNLDVYQFDG